VPRIPAALDRADQKEHYRSVYTRETGRRGRQAPLTVAGLKVRVAGPARVLEPNARALHERRDSLRARVAGTLAALQVLPGAPARADRRPFPLAASIPSPELLSGRTLKGTLPTR